MKKGVSNEVGIYMEAITREILAALDFIIGDDVEEDDWLIANKRIHDIIKREYVERKDRK